VLGPLQNSFTKLCHCSALETYIHSYLHTHTHIHILTSVNESKSWGAFFVGNWKYLIPYLSTYLIYFSCTGSCRDNNLMNFDVLLTLHLSIFIEVLTDICMKNVDDFTLQNWRFSLTYAWRMLVTLHYIIWGSHSHIYEECWWLYTTLFEVLTAMCMKNADDLTLYNLRFSQPCGYTCEIHYIILHSAIVYLSQ